MCSMGLDEVIFLYDSLTCSSYCVKRISEDFKAERVSMPSVSIFISSLYSKRAGIKNKRMKKYFFLFFRRACTVPEYPVKNNRCG